MPSQPETTGPAAPQEATQATNPVPPSPERSSAEGTIARPKLGAISPPLPWPSPMIQEIARPARPRFSGVPPEVKGPPAISSPVRNVDPMVIPAAGDTPGESASTPSFFARLGTGRDRAAQVFHRSRRHAVRAFLATKASVGKLSAKVENVYQLSKLRRQIQDVERMAAKHAGAAPLDEALPVETQPSRAARALSRFASIRGTAERAIGSTRRSCERRLATTRDRMNYAAEAAHAVRIKIKLRLPKSSELASWWTSGTGEKLLVLRRDSRLWTSMAMAALSAVLALLVVSGVRGYAPEASQAKVSGNVPAAPVAQSAAMVSKPSPATLSAGSTSASSTPPRSVVKRASLSTHARRVAPPKVTRKKVRHHEEDDYVAKDTYVYYGPSGKTSR